MQYKDLVKACENLFEITPTQYTKSYDNFLTLCNNFLVNRGYEIENGVVKINEEDAAFKSVEILASRVCANLLIDENQPRPNFESCNYLTLDKDGLLSTINTMSLISLQSKCDANLKVIKSKFPVRENDVAKLVLYMLLFYDLKQFKISAIIASILHMGGFYGSNYK